METFDVIKDMYGGNIQGGGIVDWFKEKMCMSRQVFILLIVIVIIIIIFLIAIAGILGSRGGASFNGKHSGPPYQYKVNSGRMKQFNSQPLDRFRGDAKQGPEIPILAQQVTDRMKLDNLNNSTPMDYQYDYENDMYKEEYMKSSGLGFIGDIESIDSPDYPYNKDMIPLQPIRKEFYNKDIDCDHKLTTNKLENILYSI